MLRAFPLLFLLGCAAAQPGMADASDTRCGKAGLHEVRLRPGVGESWPTPLLSCERAVQLVRVEASVLERPWTFIFTSGYPGMTLDSGMARVVPALGMTFTSTRVIELNVHRRAPTLRHEVRHAYAFEHGLQDKEDW